MKKNHFIVMWTACSAFCAIVGFGVPALAADKGGDDGSGVEASAETNTAPELVEVVSLVAGEPVNIAGYIWAVPVQAKNVGRFLELTGWRLMIEGNGLDSSEEEWIEKGAKMVAMSDGTDATRQVPQWWSAYHGSMEKVGEEWVIHLFFWAGDPTRR